MAHTEKLATKQTTKLCQDKTSEIEMSSVYGGKQKEMVQM